MKIPLKTHRFESVDSTNLRLRELALKGAEVGTVVVAGQQSAGKGQSDRHWHSPPGGLYVSVLLKPSETRHAPQLALLGGIAVVQSLCNLLPKQYEPSLKWPNDVIVHGKKIAGVLSELVTERRVCIVGMGININLTERDLGAFSKNAFPGTSMRLLDPGIYEIEEFFQVLMRKLEGLYELYQNEGFEPIRFLWEQNCSHIGHRIRFAQSETDIIEGVFEGIDSNGALMISTSGGPKALVSGRVDCILPQT